MLFVALTYLAFSEFVTNVLPWLAPFLLSSAGGGVAGYGSFRFAHGSLMQRLGTVERDVAEVKDERAGFVTQKEFELLREDLREIKADVREIRGALLR